MKTKKECPLNSEHPSNTLDASKDTSKKSDYQLSRVRKTLKDQPRTMRQVANLLDEERSNICWYIGMLRDRDEVQVHHTGECETTGHCVNYYTTNPDLFTNHSLQLNIFNQAEDEQEER